MTGVWPSASVLGVALVEETLEVTALISVVGMVLVVGSSSSVIADLTMKVVLARAVVDGDEGLDVSNVKVEPYSVVGEVIGINVVLE